MLVLTADRVLKKISHLTESDMGVFYFVPVKNSHGKTFWVPKCDAPVWLNGRRKTEDGKTLEEL